MKQIFKPLITLIIAACALSGSAHDFEVDGIYYNIINGNEASVTYRGTSYFQYSNEYTGDVTIPATVTYSGATFSVTAIEEWAFSNCINMTDITIPNTVTSIVNYVFVGCSGLTSVNIPNSVEAIGSGAFWNCTGLTSINLPNSLKSIDWNAFQGCKKLSSIIIPNSVTSINGNVFLYCNGLTSITVENGNPKYDSRNNCNAIIETATNTLITGCMNTVIPNSVTTIYNEAFRDCSGLTSIDIPNSVTTINHFAFLGCTGLTYINIPSSVTSIGEYVFGSCSGLTSITVASDNPKYDSRDYCNAIIETATNKLKIGCMTTSIPNSVTSIGVCAFYGCSGLTSFTIPKTVTSIGNYAFEGCSGLTSFTSLATTPPTIYDNTFQTDVTSQAVLYIPTWSVEAYQTADFWQNFSQIIGITIVDDFEVNGIYYHALTENTAMVISRPGEDDFYSGDVVIPDSVTYEGYTFAVTGIDDGAFEDCFELNSVVIGNAVESIGENAFQGCTDLTSVTIGSGVTTIGTRAFYYCNALETVTCQSTVPPEMASSNCFTNAAYTRAALRVPRQQIETYATADYWYRFNNIEGFGSSGMGDIDGDGEVSIKDVTVLINYLLTGDTVGEFYFESADMNHNGVMDIADVSTLINFLLTGW